MLKDIKYLYIKNCLILLSIEQMSIINQFVIYCILILYKFLKSKKHNYINIEPKNYFYMNEKG